MTAVECFMIEPTDRERVKLRRYAGGSTCSGPMGIHDASTPIGELPVIRRITDKGRQVFGDQPPAATPPRDDPRWPTACACGYSFAPTDAWQLFCEVIYRRVDGTGDDMTLRDAPPGAMWDADWLKPFHVGPDGLCLVLQTPGGDWLIDGPANNGPGWTRAGTAPRITASPSILIADRYHGWLRDGRLEEC